MNPQTGSGAPLSIANYGTSPSVAQNNGLIGAPQLAGNMPSINPDMFNTTQPSPDMLAMVKALRGNG